MLGRTDSRLRLILLLVAFVLAAGAIVGRLAWWQIVQAERLAESARRQVFLRTEVPNLRGEIYDRSGTVVLAATVTRNKLSLAADRIGLDDRDGLVELLTATLALDPEATAALRERVDSGRPYVVLARDLEPKLAESILASAREAGIPGLATETEAVRVYPQSGGSPGSSLAAQLLGFVNREGDGQYGIEQYYQELLAGTPSILEADKDANGRPLAETERIVEAGTAGAELRLTIDAGLQLALEQEVMAARIADGAKRVSAIVMDPWTGAIYASATYPTYDANEYATIASSDPGLFIDPVVTEPYEPGSVFKMFTAVAALERETVTLDTLIDDTGTLRLDDGKARISDADDKALGLMRFDDAIAQSRNVVAAKVALDLDPSTTTASTILHEVWTRLGFGSESGVDLAAEAAGLVRDPSKVRWREIDLANGSFGQGLAVTQLQLAVGYAAMVNGGTLVTPHVVASIDGESVTPDGRGRVLAPEMSPVLTGLMRHVVTSVDWYRGALVPGYAVGGKTGTAQIWDSERGAWKSGVFNLSFVGYIGRTTSHPDLVVAIRIEEGRPNNGWMPITSFQLFRRVATDAMSVPGLLPELPYDDSPIARADE